MAVKKMMYKHLSFFGFKKYGNNYVKRIGKTDCYGIVCLEREKHYAYYDVAKSISTGWDTLVNSGKTFYDLRCEVVYKFPFISDAELEELFKEV